jgi:O-antigen ligase
LSVSVEFLIHRFWPKMRTGVIVSALVGLLSMSMLGLTLAAIKSGGEASQGGGEATRQIFYVAVFFAVMLASKPLIKPGKLLALPVSLAVALCWCALSIYWSVVPGIAMRRLILTTMIIIAIFRMVDHLGYETVLKTMKAVFAIVLVVNFLAVALLPFGIHHAAEIGDPNLAGAWRGLLPQKNFAGAVCALTIIVFVLDAQRLHLILRIAIVCAAAFFLYKTKSKTSIGLLFLSLSTGLAYLRYNPSYRALLIPLVIAAVPFLGLYAAHWFAPFVTLSDDQSGLTGRVQIWPPLFAFVQDHPLHGAGFGSFWNIGDRSPIFFYTKGWVTKLGNGHNGYLDLTTQIGIPGLALVVLATIVVPLARILGSVKAPRRQGAVLTAMLVFCACHNFTETSLFDRDQIIQVFLMIAIALINRISGPILVLRPLRRSPPPVHRVAMTARGRVQ